MKEESTELEVADPMEALGKALQWASNPRGGNNFYGRVLNSAARKAEKGMGTCGVTISPKGRYVLLWDPLWFVEQTKPQQLLVLVHEAAHLILGHLERHLKSTRHFTDQAKIRRLKPIFNIAADMAANDVSVRPMVNNPNYKFREYKDEFIFPEDKHYPRNKTFEEYFEMLINDLNEEGFNSGNSPMQVQGMAGGQGEDGESGQGEDGEDGNGNMPQWFKDLEDKTHKGVDWLSEFEEMTEAEVERAISRSKREAKKIATAAVEQTQGRGTVPSEIARAIEGLMIEPKIPWTEVLKSMARSQVSSKLEESTAYPNPNFFHVEGIEPYPGYQKEFSFNILVSVDTSGSVSDDQFKEFIGEIQGIIRDVDGVTVWLTMFDAAIQHVQKLSQEDNINIREFAVHRYGYGGTDFCPPLRYASYNDEDSDWLSSIDRDQIPKLEAPDLVIMFTDGYAPVSTSNGGPLPDLKPLCPLMWVLTEGGSDDPLMEPLVLRIED